MKNKLPISNRYILERVLACSYNIPQELNALPIRTLIRLLRVRLHMSQAQLAKLAGLPQSHVAKIETGKTDILMETAQKIFRAMFCDLIMLPKPVKDIDSIINERIKEIAKKRVARLMGTMAMEKQLPADTMARELIKAEEKKLSTTQSVNIWRDD